MKGTASRSTLRAPRNYEIKLDGMVCNGGKERGGDERMDNCFRATQRVEETKATRNVIKLQN